MICSDWNTILDNDGNVILTEGLVLQDEKIWKEVLNKDIIPENHASELYFEEPDIEAFARKLEKLYPNVRYVNRLMTHSWGQKVVRFYDPDGNLIEVGTRCKEFGMITEDRKMGVQSIDAEDDQFAYRYDTQLLIERRDFQ